MIVDLWLQHALFAGEYLNSCLNVLQDASYVGSCQRQKMPGMITDRMIRRGTMS